MGNCPSNDNPIPHVAAMRFFGVLMILLSVTEFGVGGAVFGFLTNVHLGAWWAGVCTFIAGVLGCFSSNKGVVIAACVFSILGCLVGAAGAVVDGLSAGIFAYEKGCFNTNTFQAWGSYEGKYDAAYCAFGNYYNYNNYNNNFYYNHNFYYGLTNQCVCSDNSFCYGYDLASGDNCGDILTTYTNMLAASTTIVSILTVVTFCFSILTCIGACSSGYNSTSAPAPSVQTVQMASPQAQPYAIQPGVQMMSVPPVVYATVPTGGYPTYSNTYPSTYPANQVVYTTVPPQQQQVVYAMVEPTNEKQGI